MTSHCPVVCGCDSLSKVLRAPYKAYSGWCKVSHFTLSKVHQEVWNIGQLGQLLNRWSTTVPISGFSLREVTSEKQSCLTGQTLTVDDIHEPNLKKCHMRSH